MRFLLLILACLPLTAYQSVVLNGTNQAGNVTLPNASPWTVLNSYRIEFRVDVRGLTTGRVMQGTNLIISISPTTVTVTDFATTGSPAITADITGKNDVMVRYTRDQTLGLMFVEIWNSDGTGYVQGQTHATDAGTQNYNGATAFFYNGSASWLDGRVAYFRWYSASLGFRAAPPNNARTSGLADLLDYEFEGGLSDSSGRGLNITAVGSPTFLTTTGVSQIPSIADVLQGNCNGAYDCVLRAGVPVTLDGSGNTDGTTTYNWHQLSGAFPLDFGRGATYSTSSTPAMTCPAFGQYSLLLTTTISGATSSTTLTFGCTATNSSGVVIVSDSSVAFVLGSMLRSGVTTWTSWEYAIQNRSDYWLGDPGSAQGNAACIAASAPCTWSTSNVEQVNYYDAVLVSYSQYYRTGMTKYLTRARALAAFFWTNFWGSGAPGGGCGSNFIAPRDASVAGLVLYAMDGHAGFFTCIQSYVAYEFLNYITSKDAAHSGLGYPRPVSGIREPGYAMYFGTLLEQVHPDGPTRAAWLTTLDDSITQFWSPVQCSGTSNRIPCTKVTYSGAGTVTTSVGSANIVGSGTNFLTRFAPGDYIWLNAGTGTGVVQSWSTPTNDSFWDNLSWQILSVTDDTHLALTASYSLTGSTGSAGAGKEWGYMITSLQPGAFKWFDPNNNNPLWGGYAEQQWHTGVMMEGITNYDRIKGGNTTARSILSTWLDITTSTFVTVACASTPAVNGNFTPYAEWAPPFPPSGTNSCDVSDGGDNLRLSRSQNNTIPHAYGYAYRVLGTAGYKTQGDLLFGSTFGLNAGPNSDQFSGLMLTTGNAGKEYGQSFRSSVHYLADRLATSIDPVPFTLSVGFKLASVPNATQVDLLLTLPSGAQTTTNCSSSPCVVTADALQSSAMVKLTYKSAGAAVLAVSGQIEVLTQ